MEVFHLDVLSFNAEGEGTVLGSAEVDRSCVLIDAAHHGKLFSVFSDIELAAVIIKHELGQLAAFAEANHGTVDNVKIATDIHDNLFAGFGRFYGSELHFLFIIFSDDEDAFHSLDAVICGGNKLVTCGVHSVEVTTISDVSNLAEGVTNKVPTCKIS